MNVPFRFFTYNLQYIDAKMTSGMNDYIAGAIGGNSVLDFSWFHFEFIESVSQRLCNVCNIGTSFHVSIF